ncbi:MAG: LLM class flavin-dependent oxidoreductase [Betaproteobacteria bacterium]|nr:LLM class flavin-dependent oxidoreductase [Betaproteobacteria bacterium]
MKKRIQLAFDISWTHVESHWRMPGSWVDQHHPNIGMFEEAARTAERGGFDLIFLGDSTGIPDTWKGSIDDAVRYGVAWPRFDMSPWITAMSRVTSHIGYGLTYSSTFMHPFYTARLLNSMDHITNGRMAFNVVTSQRRADYGNYGYDELPDHNDRYDRLEEFIDVCRALWTSVDPDAFVWDKKTGIVADPAKVRHINHKGKYFKVKGPLSVVPSPQISPIVLQAGGSPRGTKAAAHVADHVFGLTKALPLMVKQREELDVALVAEGKDPEKVGILWSIRIIVGETEAEAIALRESLMEGVPEEAAGVWLSHNSGYDMSQLPPRFSLRELQERIVAANASPVGFVGLLLKKYGEHAEITREEFFRHGLHAATGYSLTIAGTAAQVADQLEEMFEATGRRGGFMISVSQGAPRAIMLNIIDYLVPELQRRGRYRTAYTGRTLRENLAT